MIRRTDPEGIPRSKREGFDAPPCTLDEEGCISPPEDPLYDERNGQPKSRKHAMHDEEKEK